MGLVKIPGREGLDIGTCWRKRGFMKAFLLKYCTLVQEQMAAF